MHFTIKEQPNTEFLHKVYQQLAINRLRSFLHQYIVDITSTDVTVKFAEHVLGRLAADLFHGKDPIVITEVGHVMSVDDVRFVRALVMLSGQWVRPLSKQDNPEMLWKLIATEAVFYTVQPSVLDATLNWVPDKTASPIKLAATEPKPIPKADIFNFDQHGIDYQAELRRMLEETRQIHGSAKPMLNKCDVVGSIQREQADPQTPAGSAQPEKRELLADEYNGQAFALSQMMMEAFIAQMPNRGEAASRVREVVIQQTDALNAAGNLPNYADALCKAFLAADLGVGGGLAKETIETVIKLHRQVFAFLRRLEPKFDAVVAESPTPPTEAADFRLAWVTVAHKLKVRFIHPFIEWKNEFRRNLFAQAGYRDAQFITEGLIDEAIQEIEADLLKADLQACPPAQTSGSGLGVPKEVLDVLGRPLGPMAGTSQFGNPLVRRRMRREYHGPVHVFDLKARPRMTYITLIDAFVNGAAMQLVYRNDELIPLGDIYGVVQQNVPMDIYSGTAIRRVNIPEEFPATWTPPESLTKLWESLPQSTW